jgi:hypothetical protein
VVAPLISRAAGWTAVVWLAAALICLFMVGLLFAGWFEV